MVKQNKRSIFHLNRLFSTCWFSKLLQGRLVLIVLWYPVQNVFHPSDNISSRKCLIFSLATSNILRMLIITSVNMLVSFQPSLCLLVHNLLKTYLLPSKCPISLPLSFSLVIQYIISINSNEYFSS